MISRPRMDLIFNDRACRLSENQVYYAQNKSLFGFIQQETLLSSSSSLLIICNCQTLYNNYRLRSFTHRKGVNPLYDAKRISLAHKTENLFLILFSSFFFQVEKLV